MSADRSSARTPLSVLLAAFLLHFWHYGYDYAASDQDELLPYLFHRLDPRLFATDWFVQSQATSFSVRDPAVWLLEALAQVFPVWLAVLLIYLALWLWIAHGVYQLAFEFIPDHRASALSTILVLGITNFWTLGGNDLVYNLFAPELLGWAFALPALQRFVRHRRLIPALLFGAATLFHPLVGLHAALVLGLLLLWQRRWREIFIFGGVYALCAAPVVLVLALGQTGTPDATQAELFYITAAFRNPHHYLPFSFSRRAAVLFGVLCLAAAFAFQSLRRKNVLHHAGFLGRFFAVVAGLCLLALVFTEFLPLLPVAKLQLFKLTVWIKTLAVILIGGGIVHALPERIRQGGTRVLHAETWLLALVLLAWTMTLALGFGGVGRAGTLLRSLTHRASPLGQVEAWARAQTPVDAVFAVPPSNATFRSNARRALIINRKAFPFSDVLLPAWFARLRALAPIPRIARGTDFETMLDEAYHQHDAPAWRALGAQYGIDYLVIDENQQAAPLPFERVFHVAPWGVYRLPPLGPRDAPEEAITENGRMEERANERMGENACPSPSRPFLRFSPSRSLPHSPFPPP